MKIYYIYNETKDTMKHMYEGMSKDLKTLISPLNWAFSRAVELSEPYLSIARREMGRRMAVSHFEMATMFKRGDITRHKLIDAYENTEEEKTLSHVSIDQKRIEQNIKLKIMIENDLNKAGYDPNDNDGYIKVLKLKGGRQEFELSLPS